MRCLLQKHGAAEIQRGPQHSQARGQRKAKPKPQRSERLKAMLKAPHAKSHMALVASEEGDQSFRGGTLASLPDVLPGALPAGSLYPVTESVGQEGEKQCMARTLRGGGRCKKARWKGCFCKQHFDESRSVKWTLSFFDALPASAAMKQWERLQTELALQMSLEETDALNKQVAAAQRRVDARLQRMSLRRVEVPADGSCQFHACVFAGVLSRL